MIRSLPVSDWPRADRLAWEQACQPGPKWRRGGAASHLRSITRRDLERRYGYFLECLREREALDEGARAGQQITPESVDRYITRVRPAWTPVTLARSVYKLRRMAAILLPLTDFGWLNELANDLDLVAYPKDRFDRVVSSEVLIRAGLQLVEKAWLNNRRRPIWRAGQIRDGLMIAMLAYHPLRLKNFSELELGRTLVRDGARWSISLRAPQVKNARPDLRLVRSRLNPAIGLYLTWARPRLMQVRGDLLIGDGHEERLLTGPFWVGQHGERLSYGGVERRIVETTQLSIGKSLSPHDFRRSGAFTARYRIGHKPHLASGLLQHRDRRIVDENYNLASSLEAASQFGYWIDEIAASSSI